MALLPRSQLLKDSSGRYRWCGWVTLLLGAALVLFPFAVFGYLVVVLPWSILGLGAWQAIGVWQKKPDYGNRAQLKLSRQCKRWSVPGVFLVLAIALFVRPAWRDVVLWYGFAGWVLWTGFLMLKTAFMAGVERQVAWRVSGSVAALLFAVLMLWKPRSGLSDALALLGFFALAWGVFQIALPRHKD